MDAWNRLRRDIAARWASVVDAGDHLVIGDGLRAISIGLVPHAAAPTIELRARIDQDDSLHLCQRLALAALRPSALDRTLGQLAVAAAALRGERVVHPRHENACFAMYGD